MSHCKSKSRSQTLNPDAVQLSTFIFYIHFRGNSGNLIFNVASDYSVHSKKKKKKTTFFVRDISVACGLLVYAELRSDV